MILAMEDGLRKVKSSVKDEVHIDIIGMIKKARKPKQNLSLSESKDLNDLRTDESIMILPADKLFWIKVIMKVKLG